MSVTVRRYRKSDVWEVDIRIRFPDGTRVRERRKAPVSSKSAAIRWGRERERILLAHPTPQAEVARKEVPTLQQFAPRFLEGYVAANRLKPSSAASIEAILRLHLLPALGRLRLNRIGNEEVQGLKWRYRDASPKTVNNRLSVLSKVLKVAVQWRVLPEMPCTITLLPASSPEMEFHDFSEYERLVASARRLDPRAELLVLLGGDAGLRRGEMLALEWTDIDFEKRRLTVRRSDWCGHVTVPKGGRARRIPLTQRLAAALKGHRHLRSSRVLCGADGRPLHQNAAQDLMRSAARLANLANGGIHVLRHTFCSHLAMRGAPARAIQELAGHADLSTTQRYMHLSPRAVEDAIRLLEQPAPSGPFGETVEKGNLES